MKKFPFFVSLIFLVGLVGGFLAFKVGGELIFWGSWAALLAFMLFYWVLGRPNAPGILENPDTFMEVGDVKPKPKPKRAPVDDGRFGVSVFLIGLLSMLVLLVICLINQRSGATNLADLGLKMGAASFFFMFGLAYKFAGDFGANTGGEDMDTATRGVIDTVGRLRRELDGAVKAMAELRDNVARTSRETVAKVGSDVGALVDQHADEMPKLYARLWKEFNDTAKIQGPAREFGEDFRKMMSMVSESVSQMQSAVREVTHSLGNIQPVLESMGKTPEQIVKVSDSVGRVTALAEQLTGLQKGILSNVGGQVNSIESTLGVIRKTQEALKAQNNDAQMLFNQIAESTYKTYEYVQNVEEERATFKELIQTQQSTLAGHIDSTTSAIGDISSKLTHYIEWNSRQQDSIQKQVGAQGEAINTQITEYRAISGDIKKYVINQGDSLIEYVTNLDRITRTIEGSVGHVSEQREALENLLNRQGNAMNALARQSSLIEQHVGRYNGISELVQASMTRQEAALNKQTELHNVIQAQTLKLSQYVEISQKAAIDSANAVIQQVATGQKQYDEASARAQAQNQQHVELLQQVNDQAQAVAGYIQNSQEALLKASGAIETQSESLKNEVQKNQVQYAAISSKIIEQSTALARQIQSSLDQQDLLRSYIDANKQAQIKTTDAVVQQSDMLAELSERVIVQGDVLNRQLDTTQNIFTAIEAHTRQIEAQSDAFIRQMENIGQERTDVADAFANQNQTIREFVESSSRQYNDVSRAIQLQGNHLAQGLEASGQQFAELAASVAAQSENLLRQSEQTIDLQQKLASQWEALNLVIERNRKSQEDKSTAALSATTVLTQHVLDTQKHFEGMTQQIIEQSQMLQKQGADAKRLVDFLENNQSRFATVVSQLVDKQGAVQAEQGATLKEIAGLIQAVEESRQKGAEEMKGQIRGDRNEYVEVLNAIIRHLDELKKSNQTQRTELSNLMSRSLAQNAKLTELLQKGAVSTGGGEAASSQVIEEVSKNTEVVRKLAGAVKAFNVDLVRQRELMTAVFSRRAAGGDKG